MKPSTTEILKEEFRMHKTMDIYEIYELVSAKIGRENDKTFQHSTRGVIHHLKKKKFIIQTAPLHYVLNEELH